MEKRKRGGQPGNKNAIGNRGGGAPVGNTNAQKHGLYGRDGLLNYESQAEHTARIRRMIRQQDTFKYMVEKVYSGELFPEELYKMFCVFGTVQLDDDIIIGALRYNGTLPRSQVERST
jgi:hypothetical protein